MDLKLPKLLTNRSGREEDRLDVWLGRLCHKATRIWVLAPIPSEKGWDWLRNHIDHYPGKAKEIRLVISDTIQSPDKDGLRRMTYKFDHRTGWELRLARSQRSGGHGQELHAKVYVFPEFKVAYVGSANLSLSGLIYSREWCMLADGRHDAKLWKAVVDGFESTWCASAPFCGADVGGVDSWKRPTYWKEGVGRLEKVAKERSKRRNA